MFQDPLVWGSCSFDTPDSARAAATYYRRLSNAVTELRQADTETLLATAGRIREAADAATSEIEWVPLPSLTSLYQTIYDDDVALATYTSALRELVEPYGIRVFFPEPTDATAADRFRPFEVTTSEDLARAKSSIVEVERGLAAIPAEALRAFPFDIYLGDVVLTAVKDDEAAGYARVGDDGRALMAIDVSGAQQSAIAHEWGHLLQQHHCPGSFSYDGYFNAFYPLGLPSMAASEELANALEDVYASSDGGRLAPTLKLASSEVTTVEDVLSLSLPDGASLVGLTNYALREREGFALYMEELTMILVPGEVQYYGRVPAPGLLSSGTTVLQHLAVSAARLDVVAPGAGEAAITGEMVNLMRHELDSRATNPTDDPAVQDLIWQTIQRLDGDG